jgi:hypothetical protein
LEERSAPGAIDMTTTIIATALAGGALPDCAGDLLACQADLGTCNGSLGTCTTDLGACTEDRVPHWRPWQPVRRRVPAGPQLHPQRRGR